MSQAHPDLWTLDDLSRRVVMALSHDYAGPPNGRVSEVPTPRVIRYYTTLGLIDRPAEMRGRTALYGRRHLLQLVTIKRLQAEGLSIALIQERLAGLSDVALETMAQLPAGMATPPPSPTPARSRRAFWKETTPEVARPAPARLQAKPVQGLQLAPGITLLIDSAHPLTDDLIAAIEKAAGPLLQILAQQGQSATSTAGSLS